MNDLGQLLKRINFVQNGGQTKRFHTVPVLKEQNVAAHSFGVAWLVWILEQRNPSILLVMAALSHDLAEREFGDLPAPAKRSIPGLREQFHKLEAGLLSDESMDFILTERESVILSMADSMEGMLYCIQERNFGNKGIAVAYENFLSYAESLVEKLQDQYCADVLEALQRNWLQVNY